MNQIDERTAAAVLAAVTAYLKVCPEAPLPETAPAEDLPAIASELPAYGFRPWAAAGRQAQMEFRRLMQLKAFHTGRIR